MYGFRKPFTAAAFDVASYGVDLKVWLVSAQVIGYTLSKWIGIKVVSEVTEARRVSLLIGLVLAAECALLLFAITPAPWSAFWLFCNGVSLGMVFGLVLGFLEGRRMTELFVAGLCVSFILADGFTKSVGAWLLNLGVSDAWMPVAAGALFLFPLLVFVAMLRVIHAVEARVPALRRGPHVGGARDDGTHDAADDSGLADIVPDGTGRALYDGVGGDDPSIATAKGWTVVGS